MRTKVLAAPPAGSGLRPIYGTGDPGVIELLRFFRNPIELVAQRRAAFGDITYIKAFGLEFAIPLTADGTESVAMNRQKALAAEPAWGFLIGPFFRRGILLMDFEEHRHHRLILQQAFNNKRLRGYLDEMQPMLRKGVERLPTGENVLVLDELKALTLDLALEIFLGMDLPRAEADRINKAFIDCVNAGMSIIRKDIPGTKWARGSPGDECSRSSSIDTCPPNARPTRPPICSRCSVTRGPTRATLSPTRTSSTT
ncbi:putative cytochrome P450 monooxygenase [Rhodococcus sp. MTM3W5.2]|nr:putative cytochrome P450 monooxygenase [Rhodococcus sp. MTM3W5.2]